MKASNTFNTTRRSVALIFLFSLTVLAVSAQSTKDIVLGTNNISISEVVLEYDGSTITQTSGESGVFESTALEVLLTEITLDDNGVDIVLDFFNSEGVSVRNNNFSSNVTGVGVYNQGTTTSAANQSAWEAAMLDVVNDNNILSYMFYDASSNIPSGADFDIHWMKGLTDLDYFVVEERDGNTFFTLTPLGANGDPITTAKALRFGHTTGTNSGNGTTRYDWNTGFAPGNHTGQPMMLTVVDVEEFESSETIYGIRIDNNGNADVKFYGLSEQSFEDNPGNPLYTNDITGTVWMDGDGDETIDNDELIRYEGATVYLYNDANGNGVLDAGETTPIDEVTTNANGGYVFSQMYSSGTENYIVATNTAFLPSGYTLTTDNIEVASFSSAGNTDSNNDFGYRNTSALPVSWKDFEVTALNSHIDLYWSTATEIDNELFVVERSVDGLVFEPITTEYSKAEGGLSIVELAYNYEDHNAPDHAVLYYRVKQVDFNGAFEYSAVRTVQLGAADIEVNVYPNPTSNFVQVRTSGFYQVSLLNSNGVLVAQSETNSSMDVSELSNGTYLLLIQTGGKTTKRLLSIQH